MVCSDACDPRAGKSAHGFHAAWRTELPMGTLGIPVLILNHDPSRLAATREQLGAVGLTDTGWAEYTVQLVVQSADGVWRATPLHMIAVGPDETLLQVQLQLPAEVLRVRVTAPVKDVRIHLVDSFPGLGEGESLLATMPLPDLARSCAAS